MGIMRFEVNMNTQAPLAVLGGGIAGLAVGLAARREGMPFGVFEKEKRTGGNCVTFQHEGFRFDSGAHRFHARDKAVNRQMEHLLGNRLRRMNVPSRIRYRDDYLVFPFVVGDVAAKLGWSFLFKAAGEILAARLRRSGPKPDFASRQKRKYGPSLAGLFLLNYSEKLWGLPGERMSTEIAGNRLQGLSAGTFLKETLLPANRFTAHLEGAFCYPDGGIGAISDALAAACGTDAVRTGAEVSRIRHDGRAVHAVEIKGGETFPCLAVVSTLPLDRFLRLLDPPPPDEVLAAAGFRYRQLALVALFLDRESIMQAATLYFPEPQFPFTRVYEPRNRSSLMAPPGKTSLVAEIPYFAGEPFERMADDRLVDMVIARLADAGLMAKRDVLGACVRRLADAYPVLEKGVEDRRRVVMAYLGRFANLKASGRNGTFRYLHIHNLLADAGRVVSELRSRAAAS